MDEILKTKELDAVKLDTEGLRAMADSNLKKIRAAYYAACREPDREHDPLPSWDSLPLSMREALIHVWHDGYNHGAEDAEEQGRRMDRLTKCNLWSHQPRTHLPERAWIGLVLSRSVSCGG